MKTNEHRCRSNEIKSEKMEREGLGKMKDEDVKIFSCRIPDYLHRQVKAYCAEAGITIQEFVTALLKEAMKKG